MEFYSPGEKIKIFRKILGLKQNEMNSDNFSRNLINMIEANKRSLSLEVAEGVVRIFRAAADKRGISLDIDTEYLIRSKEEEAEIYCENALKNPNIFDVEEILTIAKEYTLKDILYRANLVNADALYDKNFFIAAFKYYHDSAELCVEIGRENEFPYIYNKLGKCRWRSMGYNEAIYYFTKAYEYSLVYGDWFIRKNSLFNLALSYKKEDDIEKALECINNLISILDINRDFEEYMNGCIVKANCYLSLDAYEKAIECYNQILGISKTTNKQLAHIYNNIGLIYLDLKRYEESILYFEKAQSIRESCRDVKLSHTIIDKSGVYINKKEYNTALSLLNSAIKMAKGNNDGEYTLKGLKLQADVYKALNDKTRLAMVYKDIIELLEGTDMREELSKAYLQLSLIYLESNNVEECKNSLTRALG